MTRLLIALFCLFSFIGTAQASAGLGMGPSQKDGEERRSWIVHTLLPGEQIEDSVIVNNSAPEAVSIMLEALDGVNTLDGAYSLVENTDQNKGVGTWIKLSQTELRIPANSSKEVKFTITVPPGAPVGEQSGGIVAFTKPSDEEGKINIKLRLGTRVYITVPGQVIRDVVIEKLTPKVEGRKLTLDLVATNQSNVNLKPSIDFRVKGLLGSFVQTIEAPGIYLPGSPINLQYEWPKPLGWIGHYTVTAAIHTNEVTEYRADKTTRVLPDQIVEAEESFWVGLRYVYPALITLLLCWMIWRTIAYLRARKRYGVKTQMYIVKNSETLMDVAQATGIFPNTIAKFNLLKNPLVAGQKLLIPIGVLNSEERAEKGKNTPPPSFLRYLFLLK